MSNKLEIIYINYSQLHLLENNPRRIKDPGAIEKLKILIKEHSFQNPLQVYQEKDGSYSILCGNHRFLAAKELGYTEFPCIVYNGDRKRALARAVSDNQSSTWTEWSYPQLADLFVEIDTGDFELPDLTGFELQKVKNLIDGIVINNPYDEYKEMPSFEQETLGCYKAIIIKFLTKADYEKFAVIISQNLTPKTKVIWYPKQDFDQGNRNKIYVSIPD